MMFIQPLKSNCGTRPTPASPIMMTFAIRSVAAARRSLACLLVELEKSWIPCAHLKFALLTKIFWISLTIIVGILAFVKPH